MKFTIDNLDDLGPRDYTQFVDAEHLPKIVRALNRPAKMTMSLVSSGKLFRVPEAGARVCLEKMDGTKLFTGYLETSPESVYLGEGKNGAVYRYDVNATGEEYLLDRRAALPRTAFIQRSGGSVVRELTEDICPGVFELEAVQPLAALPRFRSTPAKTWSEQMGEVALRSRAVYRVHNGKVVFDKLGLTTHPIDEAADDFFPGSLQVQRLARTLNDVTIVGRSEPDAYVKDYFLGDGYALRFSMSETPFLNRASTLVEEEYEGDTLRPQYWEVVRGMDSIAISGGKLRVNESAGSAAEVLFTEQLELGAASHLQHGDFEFTVASDGIVGGLYAHGSTRDNAHCLAGFRIEKSGTQSTIKAFVNGVVASSSITTVAGHKYVLSTRIYADQACRVQQTYYSSESARGGEQIASHARVVLEVHEIDPATPATIAEPSKVLYDGVLTAAPGFCDYALVNGNDLHCRIAYTRLRRIASVEVRSALQGQSSRLRLVGALSEGGECSVSTEPALYFYAASPPQPNEAIVASYRSSKRSMARLADESSVAEQSRFNDNGVRSSVIEITVPEPRNSTDCANAAKALLDDCTKPAWSGSYEASSEEFPGDVFPGDKVSITAPSRQATFDATVREVGLAIRDIRSDLAIIRFSFANDAADPLAYTFQRVSAAGYFEADPVAVSANPVIVADLPRAEVKAISSTFVTVDSGTGVPPGGGFEVRRSDAGWGPTNDRNLIGRFTATSFNVPRISRVQDYWLRMYDAANNYSQHSTLLHIDYPL